MKIIIPIGFKSKDEQFHILQALIDEKRNSLFEKQQKIHLLSKQNQFLEDIRDDYSKYHNYIVQQKQDQISAMNILNQYVNDLTVSGNLSKNNIKDARFEQQKILEEMESIKTKLDALVNL